MCITPFAVDRIHTAESIAFHFRADVDAREMIELFANVAGPSEDCECSILHHPRATDHVGLIVVRWQCGEVSGEG